MRSICCECKILFDVKEPYEIDLETHGYCDECFAIVMKNLQRIVMKNLQRRTTQVDKTKEVKET
jgi:hypothetical protein